jgi:hypothetical protein
MHEDAAIASRKRGTTTTAECLRVIGRHLRGPGVTLESSG